VWSLSLSPFIKIWVSCYSIESFSYVFLWKSLNDNLFCEKLDIWLLKIRFKWIGKNLWPLELWIYILNLTLFMRIPLYECLVFKERYDKIKIFVKCSFLKNTCHIWKIPYYVLLPNVSVLYEQHLIKKVLNGLMECGDFLFHLYTLKDVFNILESFLSSQ
jgi:hypothetical protein